MHRILAFVEDLKGRIRNDESLAENLFRDKVNESRRNLGEGRKELSELFKPFDAKLKSLVLLENLFLEKYLLYEFAYHMRYSLCPFYYGPWQRL